MANPPAKPFSPYPGEERENCRKYVKYTVGKEKGEIRVSKILFFPPTNT